MSDVDKVRAGYHDILRPEILGLVPTTAKSVLDCGCGTGALGHALTKRQCCIVDGIELNKEAAHTAEQNLNRVWQDNLNRFDPVFLSRKYDAIIFADILEHLISPWHTLAKFTAALSDNGTMIASIPNIAHPWIISQLQKGLFRYEAAGLLDQTHLRFFTKTTIGQLFYSAGLKITSLEPSPSAANPVQYLITAIKPTPPHPTPQTTILILTLNAWEYTAQCITSIKNNTDTPYKILVIDNGSTDDTIKKLRADRSIYHLENSCNLGFAAGFNTGLKLIDTPYFVLCNNDIVTTPGWLTRLIKHIDTDPTLLGIGPRSNYVSGPQLLQTANYTDEKSLAKFADHFCHECTNPLTYLHRLVFFCTLFKRSVLEKVGYLDEIYKEGNFEDDDYCLRIAITKHKLAMDNSVFIHHWGSKTFTTNKIDYKSTMERNKALFMQKWQLTCADCTTKQNNK